MAQAQLKEYAERPVALCQVSRPASAKLSVRFEPLNPIFTMLRVNVRLVRRLCPARLRMMRTCCLRLPPASSASRPAREAACRT